MARRPRARTLGTLLDEMAAARGAAEAIVWRDRRVSWAEWRDEAETFAAALLALGIEPGDRVAVLLPNRPEWLVAAFAAARIGAVTAAVSTFSTPRELEWTLRHCGASALVAVPGFAGRDFLGPLAGFRAALPRLRSVVRVDGGEGDGDDPAGPGGGDALAWEDAMALGAGNREAAARAPGPGPGDICYILYTSGSTAEPKGVTLAHGHVLANGFDIGARQHLTARDRLWLAVPLFWSFGAANALPAIATHGGTAVLQERFEPAAAIETIERERCTVFYGMANMARAIRAHPSWSPDRMASMRTGLTIGTPADVRFTMETLGADELCNVYGSTETCGNCAVTDGRDPVEVRLHTQGFPLPGMEIRAVDPETRAPLPAGAVGELAVSGYTTPGYFDAPEATAAAFDAGGRFLTGDLGLVGADGRVRFRGRLRETIKTGGVNVAPLEVETVLAEHPDVRQAHVVGLPDAERDEIVAAAVEVAPGSGCGAAALRAHCRERLASYKVPAVLALLAAGDIPRTATGKVHKPGLRDMLAGKRG